MLRIEAAQIRPRKGRVEENLARIRDWVAKTSGEVDLLVFPECALSGYFVEGAAGEVSRSAEDIAAGLGVPADGAPDVVIGFYEQGSGPTYNSVAWFTPEADRYRVVHRHRKVFLPTYGVFDEERFVSPGNEVAAFDTRFGRVGLLICEEMLHSLTPTLLALDGAELLVVVAASPVRDFRPGTGLPGNLDRWEIAGRSVASEHGVHLLITHLVGSEGGKIFSGGSTLFLPGGEVGARGPLFREGSLRVEVDPAQVRRTRGRAPLLADLEGRLPALIRTLEGRRSGEKSAPAAGRSPVRPDRVGAPTPRLPGAVRPAPDDSSPLMLDLPLVEKALVSFLQDEIQGLRGFRDVVVGLSGGVDSAVSLLLAVKALGKDHVHPVLLPYATSSPESERDAREVLATVGIEGRVIPISPSIDAYIRDEEQGISALRRGNLAARFRALVIWDQAARLGALPLGTGNKSERLLGYFTWHADDSPPINPLGDLFKTQVWALARHLGVPESIVKKAPSADLVVGVHDEDEIGVRYELADRILYWILEGYSPPELVEAGFPQEAVEKVRARFHGTHWKREFPAVATLSESAIGEFYLRPVDF